jgi:NitT/TauT family transport system permease protein
MNARVLAVSQISAVALFLLAWHVSVSRGYIEKTTWSTPADVADVLRGWFMEGEIWMHLRATLTIILAGYLAGVLCGVAIGVAIGVSSIARAYAEPFLVFWNAMPSVILVPVFVVILGYGLTPKILLIFFAITFLIIINVAAGVKEIESDLVANARVLGASRLDMIQHVLVPALALRIMGSARISVGIAFQAAIVAEFFGSFRGLGYLIISAQEEFNLAAMYAALLLTMVLAWMVDVLLAQVERSSTRWMPARTTAG